MKTNKIIYWSSTGLLSALLLMSAGMYIFNNEMIQETFKGLGYPVYIIYPLALAKTLAVSVLLTQKNNLLKEWAYAGIFFNLILAFFAHVMINDGDQMGAIIGMVLWTGSYIFSKKLFLQK